MVDTPFSEPEFYGSTTVGVRGQIVLPANLRKKFKIKAGDKLLVMGNDAMGGVMLVKAEVLGGILATIDKQIKEFRGKLKESSKK
jgi:AbrB family looped-hinge helix DNA binding protein